MDRAVDLRAPVSPVATGSRRYRRAPRTRDGLARGFTLLEVLVALAIVGVALAAGLRAAGSLTGNAERLAVVSAAQWCADNALAGLRLAGQLPGIGDADFACEQLGRSYQGQLRTRATPNPNFRRIDAVVVDDDGQVLLSVSTVQGTR
jgi:general secretion pathway protein I